MNDVHTVFQTFFVLYLGKQTIPPIMSPFSAPTTHKKHGFDIMEIVVGN